MNCLDYRRGLLAGEGESDGMRAHRLQCASCADALDEHSAFERELRRGFEVHVPTALVDRLAHAHAANRRRFLVAASVAAVTAGVGAYAWLARPDPLALACIEFVMKEEAKAIMMGAMPRAEAESALAGTLQLAALERIGRIDHIGTCPFNGTVAYHIVLAVPQGKVTLLVMPQGRAGSGRRAVHDSVYASVVPLRLGSVGVVAGDPALVDSVAGALRDLT